MRTIKASKEFSLLSYFIKAIVTSPTTESYDFIYSRITQLEPERSQELNQSMEAIRKAIEQLPKQKSKKLTKLYTIATELKNDPNGCHRALGTGLIWAIDTHRAKK